jgi:hypothetical protein
MDSRTVENWRQIIKRILSELAAIPYAEPFKLTKRAVFDDESNTYLIVVHGFEDVRRLHGCLVHVEINDGKIWIQQDGTEYGLANELVDAGIPKDKIVLGFKQPQRREHSGFAVA